MEEVSEVRDSAPESAPAPGKVDRSAGEDGLREELAKWRERVPKLAAALRQRAEENTALKAELERLRSIQSAGQGAAAGIRARDELIGELEGKLAGLAERHKAAESELYRRKLEVDEAKGDVEAWKGKWQSVTRALDSQAAEETGRGLRYTELEECNAELCRRVNEAESAQKDIGRALEEVTEERDSLRQRNEQLFETTELANRQIGSLTDSLAELRMQLKLHREHEALLEARLKSASAAGGEADTAVIRLTEELHLMSAAASGGIRAAAEAETRATLAERSRREAEHMFSEARRMHTELQSSLDEQRGEVERLTGVVEMAQQTLSDRETERRELSERLQAMESSHARLEEQLAERAALVVTLEQDLAAAATARRALEREHEELEAARMRAERHATESAEHTRELDANLERQQQLMQKRTLEAELAVPGAPATPAGDDLTRIHGVGHKLAEQLNELGIRHYCQIAELDETRLADENHVLHGHRARILRDGWIEQAVKLISH